MAVRFSAEQLARLEAVEEVEIETRAATDGERHRTIIWVVVHSGEAFIRSYRGAGARWFREARAGRPVQLVVDGSPMPVRLEPAAEPATIAAVSRGFERKYAGDPATPAMVRPEVLATTLHVVPE